MNENMMTLKPRSNSKYQVLLGNDRRYWKFVAIFACIVMLYMIFDNIDNISTTIPDSIENTSSKDSAVETIQSAMEDKNKKARFSLEYLKIAQSQTNINLVREIQTNWLKPPSQQPYNITPDTTTDLTAVKRLQEAVLKLLDRKQNGFFIECGAFDGVDLSNTLHLEQNYNWTGLLVEADPNNYIRLMTRQRKAWAINACLSINPYEEKVRMTRRKDGRSLSKISELTGKNFRSDSQAEEEEFEVQCFPLTSILSALGQTLNVDYFSLDVEGAELRILKTVPWDFVFIKVITVESNGPTGVEVKEFLATKNYKFLEVVSGPWIHDYIFVHKEFFKEHYASDNYKGKSNI